MVITAKYAATCPACRTAIAAGSKIEWSKGLPAKHVACGGSVAAPRATSSYRRERFARCEGWGSDNPHPPRNGHCPDCAEM